MNKNANTSVLRQICTFDIPLFNYAFVQLLASKIILMIIMLHY